jgi:hypothetical protein
MKNKIINFSEKRPLTLVAIWFTLITLISIIITNH